MRAATLSKIVLERKGRGLVAGAFEAMSATCFVLDAGLRVGAFTPAAEQLRADGTVRLEGGRLTIVDPVPARLLACVASRFMT